MRSKLKLNLDQLSVDSFDTSVAQKPRGTVYGEQCTCPTACTCPGCPTCDGTCPASCNGTCGAASCNGTCAASCNGTCGGASCYSCNYTDCDCVPPTCQQSNCGLNLCCGITGDPNGCW